MATQDGDFVTAEGLAKSLGTMAGGGVLSANLIYVNDNSQTTLACGTDFTCSSGRVTCNQTGIYAMSVTTYTSSDRSASFEINGKGDFELEKGTISVFVQLNAGEYILFSTRSSTYLTVSLARVA